MDGEAQWLDEHVAAARKQIAASWNVLFKRYQLPLYSYCAELLRDRTEALDVVQETFARAITHIGQLRDPRRFPAWLFGIARQRCLDRVRKAGRLTPLAWDPRLDPPASPVSPDQAAITRENAALAVSLLGALETDLREALTLFYLHEFSLRQIAAICKVPEGTVKSRLHRGRQALATLMEQAHEPAR